MPDYSNNDQVRLLCFAKAPVPGRVKTRLAADIGDYAALDVYKELLKRTATVIEQWPHSKHVFYTGDYQQFLNSPLAAFEHSEQCDGNLGERLMYGATQFIEQGPVVLIGTDCPDISVSALTALCKNLRYDPVAFGPSSDGGYWAVALANMTVARICLAAELPWSQTQLLRDSMRALKANDLRYSIGPELEDLDVLHDLQLAQQHGFPALSDLKQT